MYSRDTLVLLQHLLEQGLGKRAIAKQLGISPRTVHHWIATGQLTRVVEVPMPRTSAPRPQRLDPFKPLILKRLETYPALSAERLFAECRAAGYAGGVTRLRDYVASVRPRPEPVTEHSNAATTEPFKTGHVVGGGVCRARPRTRKREGQLRVRGGAAAQPQPIALADHLEDRGVREEAVEDRGGRGDVAQKDAPVLGWPVGGDQRGRRLVAAHEDFQQIFRGGGAQFLHPEVFEDEEVDLRELPHEVASRARRVGLCKVRDKIEGAAHEDAVPRVNGADGDGRRDVRLADPGRSDQQDATVRVHKARTRELDHLGLRDLRIEAPVEVGERFHGGDPGLLEPARDQAIRPSREFVLDEQREEVERRQRRRLRLRDARRQRVDHARESECPEPCRELSRHVRKWSRVYWSIERIAGSVAVSEGGAGMGAASVSVRIV